MRNFDRHDNRRHYGFGHPRMGKALIVGVAIVALLGLVVMSLWNALLPAIILAGLRSAGAVADPLRRPWLPPGNVRHGTRASAHA